MHYFPNSWVQLKCFRFDLREFHRTILRCLGPLSAVEECVAAFVTKTPEEITNMDSEGTRVPTPEMTGSSSRIGTSFLPLFLFAMLRWSRRSSRNGSLFLSMLLWLCSNYEMSRMSDCQMRRRRLIHSCDRRGWSLNQFVEKKRRLRAMDELLVYI